MIGVCNNSNYMFQCLDYDIYNEKSTSYTKCRTLDRIDLLSSWFCVFDILDTYSRLTLRNTAPSQNCKFGIEQVTKVINLQFLK